MAFEANFSKPFPAAAEGRKKVLIIVSHPDVGKSFNHTLVEAGKKALEEEGHAVSSTTSSRSAGTRSDRRRTSSWEIEAHRQLRLPDRARPRPDVTGAFAPDLQEQLDLVDWCDLVIHQFPIYWWSVPAIHKGWFDRCLVWHYSYPANKSKWVGKQWMISTTVGPPTRMASHPGPETNPGAGIPYQNLLAPLGLGTPLMCGMQPVPMFMVGHPTAAPEEKQEMCGEYANHLRKFVTGGRDEWYKPVPDPKWSVSICLEKTIPPSDRPTRPEENLGIMHGEGSVECS